MSKIESFRRLTLEDFPEIPAEMQGLWERVFDALNRALEDVISQSLQGRLTPTNDNSVTVPLNLTHNVPFAFDIPDEVTGDILEARAVDVSGVDLVAPLTVRKVGARRLEVTARFATGPNTAATVPVIIQGGD